MKLNQFPGGQNGKNKGVTMFQEIYDHFKKMLTGEFCLDCPDSEIEVIREMNGSEMEEWASIRAEEMRIDKEIEKIAKNKEMVNSRRKILLGKVQLESNDFKSKCDVRDGKFCKIKCKSDNCSKLPPI